MGILLRYGGASLGLDKHEVTFYICRTTSYVAEHSNRVIYLHSMYSYCRES